MIGRIKQWLGIEGVKVELVIPDEISEKNGFVEGRLRFTSLNDQMVEQVKVVFIERYARGRRKEKRIDEYELGSTVLNTPFAVPAGKTVERSFRLPFKLVHSDMENMARRNIFARGLVGALKLLEGVKSEFRIEAEAKVKGVALNPFDRKAIAVKK